MSSPIIILDQEEFSRRALRRVLERAGAAGLCTVQANLDDMPDDAVSLIVGSADFDGARARENDRFSRPLRVGALLERIYSHARAQKRGDAEGKIVGPYTLDLVSSALVHDETGALLRLTDKEKHILQYLIGRRGEVIERAELLGEVWGYVEGIETHTLETHIYRLRQKIELDPAEPKILITENSGYRLA